jgi:hypothetical protein
MALAFAAPARADKSPAPEACPHAQYRIEDDPVVPGTSTTLAMGGVIALDGVCGPVAPKRWKAKRNGTTLVAARWTQCAGLPGTVRLREARRRLPAVPRHV